MDTTAVPGTEINKHPADSIQWFLIPTTDWTVRRCRAYAIPRGPIYLTINDLRADLEKRFFEAKDQNADHIILNDTWITIHHLSDIMGDYLPPKILSVQDFADSLANSGYPFTVDLGLD